MEIFISIKNMKKADFCNKIEKVKDSLDKFRGREKWKPLTIGTTILLAGILGAKGCEENKTPLQDYINLAIKNQEVVIDHDRSQVIMPYGPVEDSTTIILFKDKKGIIHYECNKQTSTSIKKDIIQEMGAFLENQDSAWENSGGLSPQIQKAVLDLSLLDAIKKHNIKINEETVSFSLVYTSGEDIREWKVSVTPDQKGFKAEIDEDWSRSWDKNYHDQDISKIFSKIYDHFAFLHAGETGRSESARVKFEEKMATAEKAFTRLMQQRPSTEAELDR